MKVKRISELLILAALLFCLTAAFLHRLGPAVGIVLFITTIDLGVYIAFNRKDEDAAQEKIKQLERQLGHITWEWNEEKKLYDDKMLEKFYEQKVDWVIGGIDCNQARQIHRPLCGLSEKEAKKIAKLVENKLDSQKIANTSVCHWREEDQVYVIDVEIFPSVIIPAKMAE